MNLLVVDWDYFFPVHESAAAHPDDWVFYDWSHSEILMPEFFLNGVWAARADGFFRGGLELPMPNDEWRAFWPMFQFRKGAKLYYSESNSQAYHERVRGKGMVDQVWLYDAHHDAGYHGDASLEAMYERGWTSCEDWMLAYAEQLPFYKGSQDFAGHLHVRYPTWRSWAFDLEPEPAVAIDRQFTTNFNGPECIFDKVFVCRSGSWVPPWADEYFQQFLILAPFPQVKLDQMQVLRDFSLDDVRARASFIDERRKEGSFARTEGET